MNPYPQDALSCNFPNLYKRTLRPVPFIRKSTKVKVNQLYLNELTKSNGSSTDLFRVQVDAKTTVLPSRVADDLMHQIHPQCCQGHKSPRLLCCTTIDRPK